jgi:phospholipid/cholesterol/gamma-HCH transport system substrate-binding protein/paraquat-inducible protein B
MQNEANYFRIGLFVIGGFVLLAGGLILFGAGKIFEPKVYFETYERASVQGIDVGSGVKFRGVPIGRVVEVDFVFNEYPEAATGGIHNYVYLLFEVNKPLFPGMFEEDLGPMLREGVAKGLRTRIEPVGITGMNYIEVDYVDPKLFPPLQISWQPRHFYIPSAPGQLTSILDSINKIMRDVEHFNLGEIGDKTVALLQNLNQAVEGADLAKVSADVRQLIVDLQRVLEEAKVAELSRHTDQAVVELTSALKEANRILANLEPATRLNSDDINATLANFRAASDNLRAITTDARRYPSRLFFGGPPPKPGVFTDDNETPAGPVRKKP